MHKQPALLCLVIFLAFNTSIFSQNTSLDIKISAFLDSLSQTSFSGTVLVAKGNRILEKRAYGYANMEFKVKNRINTKFNIASITKTFTATAVLQLVEQGKIDLHTPIGVYLENYPNEEVKKKVTISQLLTHTAGTPNFYVTNFLDKNKFRFKKTEDFVPLFVKDTLLFEPGTEYHYDAAGYVILGLIIEKISGQSYYDYLQDHVFSKATMENTHACEVDEIVINKASGYTYGGDVNNALKNNISYLSKASPGGFHYATIEDLYRFSKALRTNVLLRPETTQLMLKPRVKGYNTHLGYGIDIDKRYPNDIIYGHSGGFYGMSGEIIFFKNSDYMITILSNKDSKPTDAGKQTVSTFFKELDCG